MTRDTREVLNIEAHIKALLPESYLESIGANVQAPNHKRELHHRCMRIFDDLASRLESCHAPPDDLVAVSRAQLASIEWALYVDTQRKCPACDALRRNDVHKPECWLAAALAAPVAAPVPEYPCPARHDLTGAQCELPNGHTQNHRGAFAHGTVQWEITRSSGVSMAPAPETPAKCNGQGIECPGCAACETPAPDAMPAPNWIECPNCGGMGTTFHDILVGGTEHDTEERCCEVCKGTGKRRQEAQS